jgi:Domain of unknown function (DUF4124)
MLRFVALTACIFLFSVSIARADYYRWVDKDGKEFFTNDRRHIPKEYRDHASKIKFDQSRVSVRKQPIAPVKHRQNTPNTKTKKAEARSTGEHVPKSSGVN